MPAAKSRALRLWAVIIAGGSGTRFWPESRATRPKQLLKIFGPKTLLEETIHRLRGIVPRARILIATNQSHAAQVKKLTRLPASQILAEPVGRNTAPCAALAASLIMRKDPPAVLAILPSDHRIGKAAEFRRVLRAASQAAFKTKFPVTFGVKPSFPHTGYGYLERGKKMDRIQGLSFYRLKRFREKPTLSKAKSFLKTGRFLWNSGMFVWRADALLRVVKKYQPKMYRLTQKIAGKANGARHRRSLAPLASSKSQRGQTRSGLTPLAFLRRHYPKMPNVSIDYGLMEKMSGRILTVAVNFDWSDLGSWLSFADLSPKDSGGNAISGETLLVESQGNIVSAHSKRLIAMLGVKDFVIVDTPDALLICPKNEAESIRKVVHQLQKSGRKKYL